MEWFAFILSYPLWTRLVICGLFTGVVLLLILVPHNSEPAKQGSASPSQPTQGVGSQTAATINNTFNQPLPVPSNSLPPVSSEPIRPAPTNRHGQPSGRQITWDFDPSHLIFGWNETEDHKKVLVGVFVITGTNTTGEPISQIDAYVVPKVTQKKLPLYFAFDHNPPPGGLPEVPNWHEAKGFVVPREGEMKLVHRIPPFDPKYLQGVPIDEFLLKYGAVKFVFKYNGDQISTHDFSYDEISNLLTEMQKRKDEEYAQRQGPPQPVPIER